MKKLLIILFLVVYSFGLEQKFVEPEVAMKPSAQKIGDAIFLKLELYKEIYIYDKNLKVFISKPKKIDITSDLIKPETEDYKGDQVTFEDPVIKVPLSLIEKKIGNVPFELKFKYQGCSKAGICYAPSSKTFEFSANGDIKSDTFQVKDKSNKNKVIVKEIQKQTNILKNDTSNQSEAGLITQSLKDGNVFLILITFFGFGLLLSLTPCVFPMIPILSSIIVNAGNKEDMTALKGFFLSLVYVLSMAAAYTIAGVLAGLFGANLQVALQNPYVLSFFALIFIALAFSMFGFYRLELPKSLQTRLSKTTDGKAKQGVIGVAIMGFLSALIVGPCVAAPLAGALVYIGQTGDAVLGGAALFILSMGMGVPLLIIGAGAGKYMPKPGGWMDSVSKFFGVLMLATALWMLDRILPSILTMYLWAILFLGSAIYSGIFNSLKVDSTIYSKLCKLLSLILLIMGITLFVGAISGATNPLNPLEKLTTSVNGGKTVSNKVKFTYVKSIKELDLAIKNSNKPVMLDFYADWCISCKELEFITFADEKVKQKLSEFTLLKADVTQNNEDDIALLKRFNLFGPPGLIFWNKNGKEIKQAEIIGYKNPEEFLSHINKHF